MPKIVTDQQIFEAAIQTVLEYGYAGAKTKQIAKAANISEVTLFRKYGSKAELIKQAISALSRQLDLETAAQYTGDIAADLLRVIETYQGSASKNGPFIYTILLEVTRHPELSGLIDSPLHMMGQVGTLLARYQAEGVLKQEHPMHTLAGLLGPIIAANILRGTNLNPPVPPIDLAAHVAFFISGRSTTPS